MLYHCAQPVMIVGARNKRECGLAATGALTGRWPGEISRCRCGWQFQIELHLSSCEENKSMASKEGSAEFAKSIVEAAMKEGIIKPTVTAKEL